MSYQPAWTDSDAQGRLMPAVHRVRLCHAAALADAINRRRLLTYQDRDDFSGLLGIGAAVRQALLDGQSGPTFHDFRLNLSDTILAPPPGPVPGEPPSPTSMQWLWPSGADEGKIIVAGPVGSGQVSLFEKLNGTAAWTDPVLCAGRSDIRAVHFNELRQAIEWLCRGRWVLPVYFVGGLFSPLPDTPWFGGAIANNGSSELRTVGFSVVRLGQPAQGLANVTVRATSSLRICADADCQVQVCHCLRDIDFENDLPDWNRYAPVAGGAWSTPGGNGSLDAVAIGSAALAANVWSTIGGQPLAEAVQAMVDGAPPNLLVRRTDTGSRTINVQASLCVEFDLVGPPN